MPCADSLRTQAYFDDEVDAPTAADIERHVEQCADCRALRADLEQSRAAIRAQSTPAHAPPELRARLMRALDREAGALDRETAALDREAGVLERNAGGNASPNAPRSRDLVRPSGGNRPFWLGVFGGFGAAAAAASLAFLVMVPPRSDSTLDTLVSAHVRSLMPSHLIDVESTDRHTVKPWFAGHADVSPAVEDFADRGFRLVGGRADFFEQQRAAVVVYQHGPHIINVFSWANTKREGFRDATRNGYHLAFWAAGNLEYCAVSDTSWDELDQLERLLKNLSAGDNR